MVHPPEEIASAEDRRAILESTGRLQYGDEQLSQPRSGKGLVSGGGASAASNTGTAHAAGGDIDWIARPSPRDRLRNDHVRKELDRIDEILAQPDIDRLDLSYYTGRSDELHAFGEGLLPRNAGANSPYANPDIERTPAQVAEMIPTEQLTPDMVPESLRGYAGVSGKVYVTFNGGKAPEVYDYVVISHGQDATYGHGPQALLPEGARVRPEFVDDLPRNRYAEAIEATEPARAEFIRLELEYADKRRAFKDPDVLHPPQVTDLLDRLLRFYRAEWETWVLPPDDFPCPIERPNTLRGLTEGIDLRIESFLEHAEEIFATWPILYLGFTDTSPELVAELAASSHLQRIRGLKFFHTPVGDEGVAALAASPFVSNLLHLRLAQCGVGIAGLEALCASPHLTSLDHLDFIDSRVESPLESAGQGWCGIDFSGLHLSMTGQFLEEKYGRKKWLHPLSRFKDHEPEWGDLIDVDGTPVKTPD